MPTLGVRRETKSIWERRVPVTPSLASSLVAAGVDVMVERSPRRIFADQEYIDAGCTLVDALDEADVVVGVKEIPIGGFLADTPHVFFSHVIKGQDYNMPMLQHLLDQGCTLIDYERITDDAGRRLVFFGRHAGLAGMIDALWALGQRLEAEGAPSPFGALKMAHEHPSLDHALADIAAAGEQIAAEGVPASVHPLIVGVTGDGNVSRGVQAVLDKLPVRDITPAEVAGIAANPAVSDRYVYRVTYREPDLARPKAGGAPFILQEYYDHPERYERAIGEALPHLTMLMNGIYWTEAYPRVVETADLPKMVRCKVIGDISCDIGGSIQPTVKATEPGDPVYVVDPATGTETMGVGGEGDGPVICAVDILPAELPREASETFAEALAPFLGELVKADWSVPFEALELPGPIKRAVIAHKGSLTPEYAYIAAYLAS